MSFKTALRARILAWPGVAEIIGDRLDWVITPQPQRAVFPRGVLNTISDATARTMDGPMDFRPVWIQLDWYAQSQGPLSELDRLTRLAIEDRGTFDGVRFDHPMDVSTVDRLFDSGTEPIHGIMMQARIWSNGAL